MSGGTWIMKKSHVLTSLLLAGAVAFSVSGCAGFKVIDDEDVFYDALENVLDVSKKETTHQKNWTINGDDAEYVIYYSDGDNTYVYVRFEDEEDAMDCFEDFYEDFEDIVDDDGFDGSNVRSILKSRGSVVFNGEVEEGSELGFIVGSGYMYEDSDIYGGVYVNKNVYIEVYSVNGSKRDNEKISNFLKELKFPKP